MHTDFEDIVRNTIKKYKMLERAKRIVVGFSGGADSVSLLYFLNNFVNKSGEKIDIVPIHVNHGLRGSEADRDEFFAKKFCKNLGLELIIVRENIKCVAVNNGISVEEAGRNVRYGIFRKYAAGKGSKIAVAHTLSDSCETMLFNLTRGTGLKGLCGIPPVRDNIIRPLIGVTRDQIELFCKNNNLEYVNDSTNFERDYTRNKIRLDVIPRLKEINPSFESAVESLSVILRDNEEFIDSVAERLLAESQNEYGYEISRIVSEHRAVKSRMAYKILLKYSRKSVENKHVDKLLSIIENGSGTFNVSDDLRLRCENNKLIIERISKKRALFWEVKMEIGKNFLTAINNTVIIKLVSAEEFKNMRKSCNHRNIWFIDYDSLPKECFFRCRKSGDKFTFLKRGISKSVKKIFNELKIPVEQRYRIPILANGSEVIWANVSGVSKKYIPSGNSKNILMLKLEEPQAF